MSTRTLDSIEITLRSIARVRLQVLLQLHLAGGTASRWQLERAFRPATAAWRRAWSRGGDRQAEAGGRRTWPGYSRSTSSSDVDGRSTGSRPTQVPTVDACGGCCGCCAGCGVLVDSVPF